MSRKEKPVSGGLGSRTTDSTKAKISRSQLDRYEREREDAARLRGELHRFALWMSPVWDADNEDDAESALIAVDAFLAGEDRD